MNKIKILSAIFLTLLGIFMFIYGEIDDSPGGQFIGLIIIVIGTIKIIKNKKTPSLK